MPNQASFYSINNCSWRLAAPGTDRLPLGDLRVVVVSFVMVYSLFYLLEKVAEKVDISDEKMLINSLKVIA